MTINAPTVSAPTGSIHLRPGTGFWFNITPNHTGAEQLNGVELMIASTDGSVRYTPQVSPFYRTDLALDYTQPYSALVTLPSTIPQNVNLKAWARTYSGGVWGPWGVASTALNSSNTNPSMTPSYPIGTINVTGSSYYSPFLVTVSDADSDSIAYYQLTVTGTGLSYDSGKLAVTQAAGGSITLNGPANLTAGVTYTWQVRFWDNAHNAATDADPSYSASQNFTGTFSVPPGGGGGGDTIPYLDNSYTVSPQGQQSASSTTWTTEFASRWLDNTSITAYQIQLYRIPMDQLPLLATNPGLVTPELIWDSGQTERAVASGVAFTVASPQLALNFHYRWRMSVWDTNGNQSAWTDPYEFWATTSVSENSAPNVTITNPVGNQAVYGPLALNGSFSDNYTLLNTFTHYQVEVRRYDNQAIMWRTILIRTLNVERQYKNFGIVYGSLRGDAGGGYSSALALSSGVRYEWRAQVFDDGGLGSGWSAWESFTLQPSAPNAPTSLTPSGLVGTLTPTFGGNYSNSGAGAAASVQILLYAADQTTLVWDSGLRTATGTSGTPWSVLYDGTALTPGQVLYWKARNRDEFGLYGPYSAFVNISIQSTPNAPTNLTPSTTSFAVIPNDNITFAGDHFAVSGSGMNACEVIVYQSDGTTQVWTSGTYTGVSGTRFKVPYTGPALSQGQTILWKARTRATDTSFWGPFSALQTAILNRVPQTPNSLAPSGTNVSTLTPTLTWTTQMGDSYQHTAGAVDGRRAAFHIIDVIDQATGTSFGGYPLNTAALYHDFQTALSGWTTSGGTWLAADGYLTVTVSAAHAHLYRDALIEDAWVGAFVKYDAAARSGLLLRRSAANAWVAVVYDAGTVKLIKNVAGTVSTIQSANVDITTGQRHHLGVSMSGSNYEVFLDGVSLFSATDAHNSTQTDHGLYANSTIATNFDEFVVAAASAETASHTTSTLTANKQYVWTVKSHDGYGLGVASTPASFSTNSAPTTAITSPTNGSTFTVPNLTVTWSYASAGAYAQAKYRLLVLRTGVAVYDSGLLNGTATSHQIPTGYLLHGAIYEFQVTVADTNGLAATSTPISALALWTPPVPLDALTVTPSNSTASVVLEWSRSDLSTADFGYYAIRRQYTSVDGEEVDAIIARLTDQELLTYTDYVCPEGVTVTYSMFQVQLVGSDEVPSGSLSADTSLTFREMWIVDMDDTDYRVALLDSPSRGFDHVKDEEDVKYWGRAKPVRHKGNARYQSFTISGRLFDDERTAYETLLAIDRRSHVVCYRDGRHRRIFGNLHLNETDGLPDSWSVNLQIVEADYDEEV